MADDPKLIKEAECSLSSPGPPQFQRMLSWQLSQVVDYDDEVKKSKKKKKKHKTSRNEPQALEPEPDYPQDVSIERIKREGVGYTVTYSDGEEEVFYSAPQTPEFSSSSDDETDVSSLTTESLTSLSTISPGPIDGEELLLMEKEYQKKERYMYIHTIVTY